MRKQPRKKIALFVGSDIVAHREMCDVVRHMVANNIEPVLYYPDHLPSSNPDAQHPLFEEYAYVERKVLQEVVYPFLKANPTIKGKYPSPQQLCEELGLRKPVAVKNINNPEFFERVAKKNNLLGVISLRCTQMFRLAITQRLAAHGRFLLNLHSGILPEFRGLYSTPREIAAMLENPETARGEFGCTLHHIDPFMPEKGRYEGIDTGNIVDLKTRDINLAKTVYATNIELAGMGAEIVNEAIDRKISGNKLTGWSKEALKKGAYFSYAPRKEITKWENLGVKMFDDEEVIRIITDTFSEPGTEGSALLEKALRDKMESRFTPYFGPAIRNRNEAPESNAGTEKVNGANGHHINGAFRHAISNDIGSPANQQHRAKRTQIRRPSSTGKMAAQSI